MDTTPAPMATSRDLAVMLGITEYAARALLCRGRIPGAIRLGRAWRIPRRTMIAIAEGQPLPEATDAGR